MPYLKTVGELREALADMPQDLPLMDNEGQLLESAEVSSYDDDTGQHACVQLGFDEE